MIKEFLANRILMVTILSWVLVQFIKIILNVLREKKFDFFWLVTPGGMPSSHAAGVSSLATLIGLEKGFSSSLFAFSAVFAFITMFDAQTARRSIGRQARILNNMMEDLYAGRKIKEEKLRDLIGHTPVEVLVGAFLGIMIGFLFY